MIIATVLPEKPYIANVFNGLYVANKTTVQ
jgi:hypothetical protein